jgi:hypothetical protein
MTASNFNWFLHTLLFYHTQHVIQRQENRGRHEDEDEDEDEDENGDGIGNVEN